MAGPIGRVTTQRLRAGTWTAAALTSTYLVTALAVQTDQNDATPWIIAGEGTTTPTPARVVTNGDLSRSADGFYAWDWRFSYMTFDMTAYWLSTFLPAGVWSAPITALTYDESDTGVYLNATLNRPNFPSDKARTVSSGWSDVIWSFTAGTIIT